MAISITAAHINHIRNVCGIKCVGIGADYNGVKFVPPELKDVSTYPVLFAALLEDGTWSRDELRMLAQGNIFRVFRAAEVVSRQVRRKSTIVYGYFSRARPFSSLHICQMSELRPVEVLLSNSSWATNETSCMSLVGKSSSASLRVNSMPLFATVALLFAKRMPN